MIKPKSITGYAMVDILQPCITFNKVSTFKWYKDRVYPTGNDHNAGDRVKAFELSLEWGDKIPIGVFYRNPRPDFHNKIPFLKEGPTMVDREINMEKLQGLIEQFL